MKIIITYDIIDTRIRNKIIDILNDFGFERVQFSVFLGDLNKKKFKKIVTLLEDCMNKTEDSIYFFYLCEKDFNKSDFLGKSINKKYINNEVIFF